MPSFSSKKFIAKVSDSGELPPRAARRVFINADIAKTAKLCAGDVMALAESDKTHGSNVRLFIADKYKSLPFNRRLPLASYGLPKTYPKTVCDVSSNSSLKC